MHSPGDKNVSDSHFGGSCAIVVNKDRKGAQAVEEKNVKRQEQRNGLDNEQLIESQGSDDVKNEKD